MSPKFIPKVGIVSADGLVANRPNTWIKDDSYFDAIWCQKATMR